MYVKHLRIACVKTYMCAIHFIDSINKEFIKLQKTILKNFKYEILYIYKIRNSTVN